MLNILVPPHAVYSPWFDARTQPPVRSGPYEVRGTQSAAYTNHLFFRMFDHDTGIWRHSKFGPRCSVGRPGTTYEWRGLLAAGTFVVTEAATITAEQWNTLKPTDAPTKRRVRHSTVVVVDGITRLVETEHEAKLSAVGARLVTNATAPHPGTDVILTGVGAPLRQFLAKDTSIKSVVPAAHKRLSFAELADMTVGSILDFNRSPK